MNLPENTQKLSQLRIGQNALILGFYPGNKAYRQKLLAMGLTPGVQINIQRLAPLGDPMEVKVRGYSLSLRKKECELIAVEVIQAR